VGFTTEDEPVDVAYERMEETINNILFATQATDHICFFSDKRENNFRTEIFPEYKANRPDRKPRWYSELKEFIIWKYNSKICLGEEADDGLGYSQTEDSCIVSIDKDLFQVPGHHYNFVKEEWHYVNEEEGRLWFYKQLIQGDATDGVKGVAGLGKVKTERLFSGLEGTSDEVLYQVVWKAYRDCEAFADLSDEDLEKMILVNGICLKIRTTEGMVWSLPKDLNTKQQMELQL
jgi:5'-3' exonuclease